MKQKPVVLLCTIFIALFVIDLKSGVLIRGLHTTIYRIRTEPTPKEVNLPHSKISTATDEPATIPVQENVLKAARSTDFPTAVVTYSSEAQLNSSMLNPGCVARSLHQYKAVDTGRLYHHPPLVHYVKLSMDAVKLNFREYTAVLSVYKFLKPEKIIFYTYTGFYGKYWYKIKRFKSVEIVHQKIPLVSIVGQTVYWVHHLADYFKLSKVLEYGGLALDFDVIIINGTRLKHEQSLSECVLAAEPEYINGGFYSCVKNSAFMSAWVESYHKDYRPHKWLYNISLFPLKLLTEEETCYNIHVDDTICISPGWGTRFHWLKRKEVWRNKTAAHYFVKKDIPHDGEDLLKENFILAQMIQYVHNA